MEEKDLAGSAIKLYMGRSKGVAIRLWGARNENGSVNRHIAYYTDWT
jgi:hypothetical protein